MFDPKSLLDQFLGAQGGQAGASPPATRPGAQPPAAGVQPPAAGGAGASGLLEQGQAFLKGQGGSLASGALAGGLVSLLTSSKKGRKFGKKAVTYGGLALVGALAYQAYRGYQQRQGAGAVPASPATPPVATIPGASVPQTGTPRAEPELLPPPADSPFAPERAPGGPDAFARTILKAMIFAAKADGHIDGEEQRRIFARLDQLGLGMEERAFVIEQLSAPLDIEALVAEAATPEAGAEIYAASLLAIDPDGPAEKAYLDLLAHRLQLPPELVEELRRAVAEAEEV